MSAFRSVCAAAAALTLVPLAACSDGADSSSTAEQGPEPTGDTLAATMAGIPELSALSEVLSSTGLSTLFDGPGSYTILAPTDDAFEGLGARGEMLMQDGQEAILIAILRDHMLPGNLSPRLIRDAIENAGGPVGMTTLGDGIVTFSLDGEQIRATLDNGEGAIVGDAVIASNGAVIPVSDFLGEIEPRGTSAE